MTVVLALLLGVSCAGGDDAADDEWVKDRYGERCVVGTTCGSVVYIDCGTAFDGPSYYVNRATGEELAECGGFRPQPENCPPLEWTCE